MVQDVFLKCWQGRDQWAQINDMEGWLYRVISNQLIDYLRKTATDQRKRQQIWQRIQTMSSGVTEEFDARETSRRLQYAIAQLPAQRKAIFLLHRENDLSYQEIAAQMNLSRHTVKNQLSAALSTLRRLMTIYF